MKLLKLSFYILLSISYFNVSAQVDDKIKWWNPDKNEFAVVEGKGWHTNGKDQYHRLPNSAKANVRQPVWNLSKHSAGLAIRFRSNSSRIVVRYKVSGNHAMPHMSATGVSGVDMYGKDLHGGWHWMRGKYNFGDTILYKFSNIQSENEYHKEGREYRLFLPLYNEVTWLEIGTLENSKFEALPLRREKPIVVYGTSIAQGACASRPGMVWTSILARKMDRPLINLGFSGNGRLEEEVIDLISEIDAKIYILDCMPNLRVTTDSLADQVYQKIIKSVKQLKTDHPNTPILLTHHAGYADGSLVESRRSDIALNKVTDKVYKQLIAEGITGLYVLRKEEMALEMDSDVDGTHPSDLGMQKQATAYEKVIREILDEPVGEISTTLPVTHNREPGNYNWEGRHQALLKMNAEAAPRVVFLANSIVHNWGGLPLDKQQVGEKSWKKYMDPYGVRNFAYGWDRIENVLWRIEHDELDGYNAEQVVIMIGTNNVGINNDEEILTGLDLLMQTIKLHQPKADILLLGLLPRKEQEERIKTLNIGIELIAAKHKIQYQDVGNVLLTPNGKINEKYFSDGLHPNEKGYGKIGPVIEQYLK